MPNWTGEWLLAAIFVKRKCDIPKLTGKQLLAAIFIKGEV